MTIRIRPERSSDHAVIYALTQRAFAPMPFAAGNEQDLVDALRNAGALSLSLVAERDGEILGHVALSPAAHDSGEEGWFGLGPISVEPAHQRSGIGAALIAEAKTWLRARAAHGCILVGDPGYYSRHGFHAAPEHVPIDEPAVYFMAAPLAGRIPPGRFSFHPAFYA